MEVEEFLEHHGVRGMKWGQHKGPIAASGYQRLGTVRIANYGSNKSSKKSKEELAAKDTLEVGNALAKLVANSHIYSAKIEPKVSLDLSKINAKYDASKFHNDDYYGKYRKETRAMYEKHLQSDLPKGVYTKILSHPNLDRPGYVVIGNKAGVSLETNLLTKEGFTHSDALAKSFVLNEIGETRSFITAMSFDEPIVHSDPVEEFLEHHGVRGMKWGQHLFSRSGNRSNSSGPAKMGAKPPWQSSPAMKKVLATPVPKSSKKSGKPEPSHDAVVMAGLKAKAKAHGLHTLTNEEIRVLTTRAELASKYAKAFPKKPSLLSKAASIAVETALTEFGGHKLSRKAVQVIKDPYAANAIFDFIKPGGQAQQINKAFKKNKKN